VKKGNIAIIPARGGSKRIPQKNIYDFCGKPMIAWTIEAAKNSILFDRIIVSTDDEKIAEISKGYGAEVPFLRDKYTDDYSSVSLATVEAVKQAQEYYNEDYECVFQLMPNCPLRKDKDIIEAYRHYLSKKLSFQISCFKYGWMNPWWAVKLNNDLKPDPIFKKSLSSRSQDLEQLYCPTGAIWIAKKNELLRSKTFYGENHSYLPLDWKTGIDIDDMEDLEMAKAVYLMVEKKNESCN
jgi:CMP-N-acetylneuraminic acid synthetase